MMSFPPAERFAGESRRFVAAVLAAAVAHVLFFSIRSLPPFARADSAPSPSNHDRTPPLAVQFVAPPPPPPDPVVPQPVTPPPAPPQPPAPEPVLEAQGVPATTAATDETVPKTPEVADKPSVPPPPVAPARRPPPRTAKAAKPIPLRPAPEPAANPSAPSKKATVAPPSSASAVTAAPAPTAPSYRSNPKPPYPPEARRAQIEGTTYLQVEVLASGAVGSVSVIRSSGSRLLDDSAASTVRDRWHFRPATRGGRPVSLTVTVPIRFQLR